ncbi:hypothetical protein [Streptomyces sp. NPDC098101]|uniref:hypothetical protein n=1 Tax=Streptomyces sp. NPDC098101 TaxID=3366096 RepID=UPI0038049A01
MRDVLTRRRGGVRIETSPNGAPPEHFRRAEDGTTKHSTKTSWGNDMSARIKNSVRVAVVAVSLTVSGLSFSATAIAAPAGPANSVSTAAAGTSVPAENLAAVQKAGTVDSQDNWAWD